MRPTALVGDHVEPFDEVVQASAEAGGEDDRVDLLFAAVIEDSAPGRQ